MVRKVFIIIILALSLIIFLIYKTFFLTETIKPRLIDRLPSADFIGKINLLELARETRSLVYDNKFPFRDLVSYEFLLSQGKSYGLNLQNPVYLFGNERGDWGCFIQVTDSSKIASGIDLLLKSIKIQQISILKEKVFFNKKENLYLTYRSDYLLIYKGLFFKDILNSVVNAKFNSVQPVWNRFLNEKHLNKSNLIIYSNWSKFKEVGIETAIFAYEKDSLNINLKSYLRKSKSFNIKSKKSGLAISPVANANKYVELHLDISSLRNNLKDPLYSKLVEFASPIGFPVMDFLKAWEGDLCFVEGGTQKNRESYIETELDENFNYIEVKKFREINVPGYSLYLSINNYSNKFLKKLFEKGIMTNEDGKIRVLYSPLLSMKKSNNYLQFYSGNKAPQLIKSSNNKIVWTDKGNTYRCSIDSINNNEAYGLIQIPISQLSQFKRFYQKK